MIGHDPLVYTPSVEGMATERQQTELMVGFKLGQTNGAVPSVKVPCDGTECEERERVQQFHVAFLRVRILNDVVAGREPLIELSEEEVNAGGYNHGGSDDHSSYLNG